MYRSLPNDEEQSPTGLAKGLGWFSIALGATQLIAPRMLARAIGIHEPGVATSIIMRLCGAREILAGVGILSNSRRPNRLWARVVGDVADFGLLAVAAMRPQTSMLRLGGGTALVAGAFAADVIAARRSQRSYEAANKPVIYSVTINRPPSEVYAFYRRLDQLPMFMDYLESVEERDATHSHWVAKLPIGRVAWDAEIIEDVPGEVIAWRSTSKFKTQGRVTFTRAPGREATEVRVEMQLGFSGASPSNLLAKFFAKPQIKGDLHRLKQVLETGEVLYSDASQHRKPHPAQPSENLGAQPKLFVPTTPRITAEKGVTR